jgi:hypothetical protein
MDLTKPIDITAVNGAVVKHKNVMVPIDRLQANDVLKHCTPMPGITNSIVLGKVEGGTISKKYSGVFLGSDNLGKIVPRTLTVYPIVAEMSDEPERYRRSWITEVKGGLDPNKHPFEVWLIQHGINIASEDLHNGLFIAKYDSDPKKKELENSFDAWGTILENEKTAGNISIEKGNMFATGAMDATNIGQKLLDMWRAMPKTFRKKKAVLWVSEDLGDDYDDWLESETIQLPGTDESEIQYLKKTNKRVQIIRTNAFPEGSQFVLLTTKENMVYGYDKESDLTGMKAFASGNPYLFTATMKYVFGCQFVSIHPSELCINDQPLKPAASEAGVGSEDETESGEEPGN